MPILLGSMGCPDSETTLSPFSSTYRASVPVVELIAGRPEKTRFTLPGCQMEESVGGFLNRAGEEVATWEQSVFHASAWSDGRDGHAVIDCMDSYGEPYGGCRTRTVVVGRMPLSATDPDCAFIYRIVPANAISLEVDVQGPGEGRVNPGEPDELICAGGRSCSLFVDRNDPIEILLAPAAADVGAPRFVAGASPGCQVVEGPRPGPYGFGARVMVTDPSVSRARCTFAFPEPSTGEGMVRGRIEVGLQVGVTWVDGRRGLAQRCEDVPGATKQVCEFVAPEGAELDPMAGVYKHWGLYDNPGSFPYERIVWEGDCQRAPEGPTDEFGQMTAAENAYCRVRVISGDEDQCEPRNQLSLYILAAAAEGEAPEEVSWIRTDAGGTTLFSMETRPDAIRPYATHWTYRDPQGNVLWTKGTGRLVKQTFACPAGEVCTLEFEREDACGVARGSTRVYGR